MESAGQQGMRIKKGQTDKAEMRGISLLHHQHRVERVGFFVSLVLLVQGHGSHCPSHQSRGAWAKRYLPPLSSPSISCPGSK